MKSFLALFEWFVLRVSMRFAYLLLFCMHRDAHWRIVGIVERDREIKKKYIYKQIYRHCIKICIENSFTTKIKS